MRYGILSLLVLLLPQVHYAQNMKGSINISDEQKPNASRSITGEDIISVDPFTGTGSVNIPIYQYSIDGMNLNVGLNYTTKGIRVDELASSIGLGWQLNAGGSITRDVNNIEDEITLAAEYTQPFVDYVEGYLVPGAIINTIPPTFQDDDREKDVFHLQLPGRSLDVVFERSGSGITYQTYPYSEIKIELITQDWNPTTGYYNTWPNVANGSGSDSTLKILNFIVTDERGNKFYYERGDYQHKTFDFNPYQGPVAPFSPMSGTYYPTEKWNLVKIVTYKGFEVKYEYARSFVEYTETISEKLYPRSELYDGNVNLIFDPLEIKDIKWKGIKTHISKISYPNNVSINFDLDYSVGSRCDCEKNFRLKNIIVEEKITPTNNNTIKYKLNQAYFATPSHSSIATERQITVVCSLLKNIIGVPSGPIADSLKNNYLTRGLRLKLKSIQRIGSDNTTTEPYYTFGYNPTPLPYRFSYKKDFYGYYNAKTTVPYERHSISSATGPDETFYLSIPYHTDPQTAYSNYSQVIPSSAPSAWGADRSYNFDSMQACVLTKMSNCSGGEWEIQYQDYTLTNPACQYGDLTLNYNHQTGYGSVPGTLYIGCTIDPNIVGSDVNDGLVVGKVISRNRYSIEHTVTREYQYTGGMRFNRGGYYDYPEDNSSQVGAAVFTNYFVSPLNLFNGSNHGFSTVRVINKGYNNNILSTTKLYFKNLMSNTGGTSFMTKYTGDDWHTATGSLKKYALGALEKKETLDENDFVTNSSVYQYAERIKYTTTAYNIKWNSTQKINFGYNLIDNSRNVLESVVQTQYFKVSPTDIRQMASTTHYTFDQSENIKSMQWTNSQGETFRKHIIYNYDYKVFYPTIPSLTYMHNHNMQFQLSQETWRINSTSDSVLLDFNLIAPLDNSNKLATRARFRLNRSAPLAHAGIFTTNILRDKALHFNYPYTSYGTNLQKFRESTLLDNMNNELEVVSLDGTVSSAIWDTRSNYKIADASNAHYNAIAYTSFESLYADLGVADYNKGNWDFDPEYITAAPTMTGSYCYELEPSENHVISKPLSNMKYILSFWADKDPIVSLYNGATPTTTVNMSIQNTVGSWKLYTATFTPAQGEHVKIIGISGTIPGNTKIDEMRLHPANAIMTSSTYKPLFGLGSTTDGDNYITYYEYDALGRLTYTRDMRGNVISKSEVSCGESVNGGGPASMEYEF